MTMCRTSRWVLCCCVVSGAAAKLLSERPLMLPYEVSSHNAFGWRELPSSRHTVPQVKATLLAEATWAKQTFHVNKAGLAHGTEAVVQQKRFLFSHFFAERAPMPQPAYAAFAPPREHGRETREGMTTEQVASASWFSQRAGM